MLGRWAFTSNMGFGDGWPTLESLGFEWRKASDFPQLQPTCCSTVPPQPTSLSLSCRVATKRHSAWATLGDPVYDAFMVIRLLVEFLYTLYPKKELPKTGPFFSENPKSNL
jgi:hypothetical protein